MNINCLESFLIPNYEIATESTISDIINVDSLLKAIGIENLDKKDKQKISKNELYKKYNLDNLKAQNSFKTVLMKDIDNKIKKMVNAANRNTKLFKELKQRVLNRYNNDESSCSDILRLLKPGYFTSYYYYGGHQDATSKKHISTFDYIIIEDQEILQVFNFTHIIVEVLNLISIKDDRYNFASFQYSLEYEFDGRVLVSIMV